MIRTDELRELLLKMVFPVGCSFKIGVTPKHFMKK